MRLLVLGLATLIAGCTALPRVTPAEEAWLLTGAALHHVDGAALGADVPDMDSLLALTPEMERFAEKAVAGRWTNGGKVRALLEALLSPKQLGLRYDETATYSAAEAFTRVRANCLSFGALFIALARHVGVEADFNEVDVPPVWNMHDTDTLVLYKHVNVLVRTGPGNREVVDFNPEVYDTSYPQRKISDRVAAAQYYNNLAIELLLKNEPVLARRHLVRAISLAPGLSYLWGNLGSAYRRAGQIKAAELAFVKAINVEPSDYVAIGNVARVFAETGQLEIAKRLERRAGHFQKRNPYYRYREALNAFANRDYETAKRHALAAIRLYYKEHRFHFLLGTTYRQLGDQERARQSLDRAIALTSDDDQASRYRREAEMLMSARL